MKHKDKEMKRFSIYVEKNVSEMIRSAAEKHGMTISGLLDRAVRREAAILDKVYVDKK
jgi:uncharacterized protein (DUF1778 family)